MSVTDAGPVPCPNCAQPMEAQDHPRRDNGRVRIDVCFPCGGIWFDVMESSALAPSAVIDLFRSIYAHRGDQTSPVASRMNCPRCRDALALSHDLGKAGPFTYFRCQRGDGRYTPFFQFLREKQFVRSMTGPERDRLRAQVRQIRCSGCGAPIDLETETQCRYCHAPVSFFDSASVEAALRSWNQTPRPVLEPQRPALRLDTLAHGPDALGDRMLARVVTPSLDGVLPDLVRCGIDAIAGLFD